MPSPGYINVRDGQRDRRTDGRTTYDSNTALALRASRSKNHPIFIEVMKVGGLLFVGAHGTVNVRDRQYEMNFILLQVYREL